MCLEVKATASIISAILPRRRITHREIRYRVAVVAHGGVLDSIFRYVAGLPLEQPRCFITTNASLTIVSHGIFYGTSRAVIETWCDTSHLKGLDLNFGLG